MNKKIIIGIISLGLILLSGCNKLSFWRRGNTLEINKNFIIMIIIATIFGVMVGFALAGWFIG